MPNRNCESCGKVMKNKADFPRGNYSSRFCADCVDERGNLKTLNEIRENLIEYYINKKKYFEDEAVELVDNRLKNIPLWKAQMRRILEAV